MNIAVRYFILEDDLELCLHVAEPDLSTFTRTGRVDQLSRVKAGVGVPDGSVVIGGQTSGIVKRNNFPRGGKYGHMLERLLHSFGDLARFFLIRVRCSKHHYETGEKQCDEVGVGHQPPLIIRRFGMFSLPRHYAAFFLDFSAASRSRSFLYSSSRNDVSLPSINLGFWPSSIPSVPSCIIVSRSSLGSQPSMAIMRDFLKKSSFSLLASFSREMIPSRRALLVNLMT